MSAPGVSLLLDCGASALPAIKRRIDPRTIAGVAVTHLHGDHFGGIPFLVLEQHYAGRAEPLVVGGPAGLPQRLRALEAALYGDWYERTKLGFEVLERTLGSQDADVGGAQVSAIAVRHGTGAVQAHGLRIRIDGALIAYSGDCEWSDALPRLADGADLFICEATNFDRDTDGHIAYRTLMAHRTELDCGRIVLTHLGSATLAHLGELELEHAVDGTVVEL